MDRENGTEQKEREEQDRDQLSLNLDLTPESQEIKESENSYVGRTLEWVCHPARRNRNVTILLSLFIVLLLVIVYYATDHSVLFTILAFIILMGSLSAFYFPTRYRFTEEEIIIKTRMQTLHKKWGQYRTYYPDKNGVLLSPFARRSRLENFRGVYIRFWYNKDEVVAFVKEQIERQKSATGKVG